MFTIPNLLAPPDDVATIRVLDHPACLVSPMIVEDEEDYAYPIFYYKHHTIESSIHIPPPAILAAMFAKTWIVEGAISWGGATLTVSETLTFTDVRVGHRSWFGGTFDVGYSGSATSGDDSISLEIGIGELVNFIWERPDSLWSLPLYIEITSSTSTEDPEEEGASGHHGIGSSQLSPAGAAYGGVVIDFYGESVLLYELPGHEGAEPTGALTFTVDEWLTP